MKKRAAPLAGEMSGHFFFAEDYLGYDDGLYAALRLLSILQRSDESLADFKDALPAMVNTPEIRVPCSGDLKWQVVEEVKARQLAKGRDLNDTDGARVREEGGWWLLRASNTQEILVVRCEAPDAQRLAALVGRVRAELEACGLTPAIPFYQGTPRADGDPPPRCAIGL
jgi:phosphomannomutase